MKKALTTVSFFCALLSYYILIAPQTFSAPKPKKNKSVEKIENSLLLQEPERIYFQLDKPLYKAGETVWLKPYLFFGSQLRASKASYLIELIDPQGRVVEEIRASFIPSKVYGIPLSSEIKGGEYQLRIKGKAKENQVRKFFVTSYQAARFKKEIEFGKESYNTGDQVKASFKVKRDTGENLVKAPVEYKVVVDGKIIATKTGISNEKGEVDLDFKLPKDVKKGEATIMVTVKDGKFKELKAKTIPLVMPRVKVNDKEVTNINFNLFPEGGTFLPEIPNKIFFQAKTKFGKPVEIQGNVFDSDKKIVATFESYHRGFGEFTFTPAQNKIYKIKITKPVGVEDVYSFPGFSKNKIHLNLLENNKDGVSLKIQSETERSDLSLLCRFRETLIDAKKIKIRKGDNDLFVAMPNKYEGIYQINILDNKENVLAQRKFYRQWGKKLKIEIQVDKKEEPYAPRDKVELTILTSDEEGNPCAAEICLAVVNDTILSQADDKTAHLVSQILLTSEIEEEIFEPNFYFSGEEKSLKTLDYLLNTHKWEANSWQSVATPFDYVKEARVLFEKNKIEACLELLYKGLKKFPGEENLVNLVLKITNLYPGYQKFEIGEFERYQLLQRSIKHSLEKDLKQQIRLQQRIRNYFNLGIVSYEQGEFQQAEDFAETILMLEPSNHYAKRLRDDAFQASHHKLKEGYLAAKREGWSRFREDMMQSRIPYTELITFPDKEKWAEISRREITRIQIIEEDDPPEIQSIKRSLENEKITLDFTDTPFTEVINFIRNTTKVNIVIDPEALEEEDEGVTLNVTDLKLKSALNILLQFKGLTSIYKDKALFITKPASVATRGYSIPELHDVRDLIGVLKDFPGIQITLDTDEGGVLFDEPAESAITEEYLSELIKQSIDPPSWDEEGRSIAISSGQLLVVHTSDIQNEIRRFLNGLRKFSGLKFAAETRFIAATDEFLDDIGVDFRGIGDADDVLGFNSFEIEIATASFIKDPALYYELKSFPSIPKKGKNTQRFYQDTLYWNPNLKIGADGTKKISFYLSDSITSFSLLAEGRCFGSIGRTKKIITSVKPVYLQTKIPSEVTVGDRLDIPVTITNRSATPKDLHFAFTFEEKREEKKLTIPAQSNLTSFYPVKILKSGLLHLKIKASGEDILEEFSQDILSVERGFPKTKVLNNILDSSLSFSLALPKDMISSSLKAEIKFFPSPLATLKDSLGGMLQQPSGCFEQTTANNYPNTLIMNYLRASKINDPEIEKKAQDYLAAGYKKLISFECKNGGFEWFGEGEGHECLTAMGILQFEDMKKVYPGVDSKMIERTVQWLKNRNDITNAGYLHRKYGLHSWGASKEIKDAYILYCLTEAGYPDLARQESYIKKIANDSKDPYLLALIGNIWLEDSVGRQNNEALRKLFHKLISLQEEDGSFTGTTTTVVCSSGINLKIETTALAVLAMLKEKNKNLLQIRKAISWLGSQRNAYGMFGTTQATVLTLKAFIAYDSYNKKLTSVAEEEGLIELKINQQEPKKISFSSNANDAFLFEALAPYFQKGKNSIVLNSNSKNELSFSLNLKYRSDKLGSSKNCQIGIENKLEKESVKMGESVALKVKVWNKSKEGIPMSVARVGFPGGLNFQLEELKELKKKGIVDFYETKPREIIFYFRQMNPEQVKEFTLNFSAEIPGIYYGEASSAYLYYTNEYKQFVNPIKVNILK